VDSFEFSQTRQLSEADYLAIHALSSSRWRFLKVLLLLVVGIVCLFWSYTLLLGVILLVFGVLSLAVPQVFRAGSASSFRAHSHLHQPLTFCVSDQGLSVSSSDLDLHSDWRNLAEEGNTFFCGTFEDRPVGKKWIQITWDTINTSYPSVEDPVVRLRELGLDLPRYVEVVGWEAGKYVTFSHGADDLPALSSFVTEYAQKILGATPDSLAGREELL
jgi:hypothetical protein